MDKNQITVEDFVCRLVAALKKHYGDDYMISVQEVIKNNGVRLHGVTIRKDGENIAPNIYVDDCYRDYIEGCTLTAIVERIADCRDRYSISVPFDADFYRNYDSVKEHLGFKLINRRLNEELLKEVPYVEFADLAIVFLVYVDRIELGQGMIMIRNEHIDRWGISPQTLYEDAVPRMAEKYPPYIKGMLEMLEEIYTGEMGNVYNHEMLEALMEPARECMDNLRNQCMQMYVLTNTSKSLGSAVLAYPGSLEAIADEIGGDYYVIPSSIHEVIIIPEHIACDDESYLSNMVSEVNREALSPEEVLSDHAYMYRRADRCLISVGENTGCH